MISSMPETEDSPKQPDQVTIARWSDRFFAWLIDCVIVWVGGLAVWSITIGVPNFESIMEGNFEQSSSFGYSIQSLVFFLYWLILEYKTGQSIGKIALRLKITNLKGEKADLKSIVISSFGKSFLLPVDLILGWIFTNKKRQRIFNRIGDTIVIKLDEVEKDMENTSYKMD